MERFEINLHLEHVKGAKQQAVAANREFLKRVDRVMTRLIHEAAAQRMSVSEVAHLSGFSNAQIKARMKAMDLNPTTGKVLLSKQAASVLEFNAEILGISPNEIDLMSPLAYLPAGPALKEQVSSVTDLDESVSGNTYEKSKPRIEADIRLGVAAEEDWNGPSIKPRDLTDEQIAWLASWLAGCGLTYIDAQQGKAGA